MFYTGFVTYSYQIFSTMKKLVILVVAVLSINLAFGQENKVDKDPVFVGCEDLSTEEERWNCLSEKINVHIAENFEYPELARQLNIQGKVIVEIIIETDGEVNDIRVSQSVDELLDNEAIRVMKLLPKFIPAQKDGKSISVSYEIPINCFLQGDDTDSSGFISIETLIKNSGDTRFSSSLETYTFEKGNENFAQTIRFVKDKYPQGSSIRLSLQENRYDTILNPDNPFEILTIDKVTGSINPVQLEFLWSYEELMSLGYTTDTTVIEGRRRNAIVIDTIFTGYSFVNLNWEHFKNKSLYHNEDTIYVEIDLDDTYHLRSYINYGLNDFRPIFNLDCNYQNLSFENIIQALKGYAGKEKVLADDELLTIKLKDDFLFVNIDAAKCLSNSWFFKNDPLIIISRFIDEDLISAYKKEHMLPDDINFKVVPSSGIKTMDPIEYRLDIEPLRTFFKEKTSW